MHISLHYLSLLPTSESKSEFTENVKTFFALEKNKKLVPDPIYIFWKSFFVGSKNINLKEKILFA